MIIWIGKCYSLGLQDDDNLATLLMSTKTKLYTILSDTNILTCIGTQRSLPYMYLIRNIMGKEEPTEHRSQAPI